MSRTGQRHIELPPSHGRLLTLDALRGVAAILVVVYHALGRESGALPGGYLAVDFFFVLSGLVISRAYQARLHRGMGFADFMKARLIRLYPLFFLGLVLDALRLLAMATVGAGGGIGIRDFAFSFIPGLAMLPSLAGWEALFRINSPAWSLFMEIVVNAIFALALFRLRSGVLLGVAVASFVICAIAASAQGSFDLGATWSTAAPGLVRTLFGFSTGMLIGRIAPVAPRPSWLVLALGAALVTAMAMPQSWLREALCIAVAMPVIVWLGTLLDPRPAWRTGCKLLGEASYPMYAIHWALIFPIKSMGRALHMPDAIANALAIVLVFAAGVAASRLYEIPVRRALNKRLGTAPPAAGWAR